jgi:hypothetical protein
MNGVTRGILHVESGRIVNCGYVCNGRPSMGLGLLTKGWNINYICLQSNTWSRYIPDWFSSSSVLDYDAKICWSSLGKDINVWFCDTNPFRKLDLWHSNSCLIVTRCKARGVDSTKWDLTQSSISHSSCGGMTDGSWEFYIYTPKNSESKFPELGSTSRRTLLSVLNTMLGGKICSPPAKISTDRSARVVKLRAHTYHCNGLLPWSQRTAFVVAPSTPTQWVRRHLSHCELLHACDVPTSLSDSLRPHQLTHLCHEDKLIPLKVVLILLDGICTLTSQSTPMNNHQGSTKCQCVQSSVHDQPGSIANTILTSPEADETHSSKAVKLDNAPVPVHLWNHAIVTESDPLHTEKFSALNQLCLFALRWWKKRLLKEFVTWYKTKHS